MTRTSKILYFFAGLFLTAVSAILGLLEILAILDPVGTKMSDDADPFGDPTIPWYQHLVFILVITGCATLAVRLLKKVG